MGDLHFPRLTRLLGACEGMCEVTLAQLSEEMGDIPFGEEEASIARVWVMGKSGLGLGLS